MFPVKRRRETPPSDAPPSYELSMRHQRRDHGYQDHSQQNRKVRGPSLAPTSRPGAEPERHGQSIRLHAQSRHSLNEDHLYQSNDRSLQYTRSWHEDQAASWPNPRGYDDQDMLPESPFNGEAMPLSSASLPGLSLLLQNRETVTSRRLEDALRREVDSTRAIRPQNADTGDALDQRRPIMTHFVGHADRFRNSMDSGTTSPASMGMRDSIGSHNSDDLPIPPFSTDREASGAVSTASYNRVRAGSNNSNASMQSTSSPSYGASSAFTLARTIAKSSRYLREIDRRNILHRIKNGEKQATLAKEYQVSRAAICNLNKHREVVLSRKDENPLAKHPKKPRAKGDTLKTKSNSKGVLDLNDVSPGVHEVRSRAATVLMTTLMDHQAPMADFKRSAYRLLRLVVEEAISLVPLKRIQVAFTGDAAIEGVEIAHPFCGVAMKVSGGGLLLQVFRELEPQRAIGSIRVTSSRTVDAELPPALGDHNVFLFDLVMASSEATCLAVQSLIAQGAKEDKIWLATLSVSVPVADAVVMQFPNIKIVTAQMDRSSLHADEATRAASSAAIHCLIKRFLETFAFPRNA